MLLNEWELHFEHVDVESGIGFIVKETCVIYANNKIMVEGVTTPSEPFFSFWNDVHESGDYTLRDYTKMVEDVTYYEVIEQLIKLFGDGEVLIEELSDFIIDGDWDEQLQPWLYYDSLEDLPEGLYEAWNEHKNK